jgi:hypothetical protein
MYRKLLWTTAIIATTATLSIVAYFVFHRSPNNFLTRTQKKAGFTIFIPNSAKSTPWLLDTSLTKYDSEIGVLYTTLTKPDKSNKITMTQQVLPDPFTDIPNYSSIFYSKLNIYQELNLPIGKVSLTRPTELKGGQSAVAVVKGTLMFLHPYKDLGDTEWKEVFKNLESL